ncbi:hypothetical protein R1flu_027451 [Riccia fluitans]|uniref:Uncharacterized protein n=1 Tax=Riccia fluitans TaxID=41844 RepID=A0ABD1XMW1_9MARC
MPQRTSGRRAWEPFPEREVSWELKLRHRRRRTVAQMNAIRDVEMDELERLNFLYALGEEYCRSHVDYCIKFILSFDRTTMIGNVGVHQLTLSKELLHTTFAILVPGKIIPRLVHHEIKE